MTCSRCGGPSPVEGETYRWYWPCGCAVRPDFVTLAPKIVGQVTLRPPREDVWVASGHGTRAEHPTEEGAIAAWRAALGPYQDLPPLPADLVKFSTKTAARVRVARPAPLSDADISRYLGATALAAPKLEPVKCPCVACGQWTVVDDSEEGLVNGSCRCGKLWAVSKWWAVKSS